MTLREVMHAHIPTLTPESTVRDAVDKMDIYQFPALVVVSEEGNPLAVITEGDICRAATKSDSLISLGTDRAFAYGTSEPVCLDAGVEIGEAFHKMIGSGLTIIPVLEEGQMAGIVLRVDLMQALLLDSETANNV